MELNASDRTLSLKVVYYGPALGGKTTNLQTIHALNHEDRRSELVSINTSDDRTLFFDLLPIGLGQFVGYELRLKLYTVPGQPRFDVTRKKVLAGADAVVFVADSRRSQKEANVFSLKNLQANLLQNKLDPNEIPLVFQYNKRDLPHLLDLGTMNESLNSSGRAPAFPAIATAATGVMDCLAAAVAAALQRLVTGRGLVSEADARRAAAMLRDELLALQARSNRRGTADAAPASDMQDGAWIYRAEHEVTSDLQLLEEAASANIALSERLADAEIVGRQVDRRERQSAALAALAGLAGEAKEPAGLEKELVRLTLDSLGVSRASLLVHTPAGSLGVRLLAGHEVDPLSAVPSPPLGSVADRMIVTARQHVSNDLHLEILFGQTYPEAAGVFTLLFTPLRTADGLSGGLFLYGCEPGEQFDAKDALFVEAACRILSLARARA